MDTNKRLGQRTRVASAVSTALTHNKSSRSTVLGLMIGGALMGPVAHAQESNTAVDSNFQIEEVVVTGIRGSLQRAVDQKRNADGVVDAISAEDIGVFPDTNLAESLQRITGVSIDRSRGEGSKVTVRGFGPEFNLVTLNGRQMPTANGDNRSFDFADLASEGIAGVQVFKTGQANVASGGIGSTINIKTTRPLDSPGRKAVAQLKGVFDTSTEKGSDVTPELSGVYSNTFADDTIGFSVSASYQERDNGQNKKKDDDQQYENIAHTGQTTEQMRRLRCQQFVDLTGEYKNCRADQRRDLRHRFEHFNQGLDGKHPFQPGGGVNTTAFESQC